MEETKKYISQKKNDQLYKADWYSSKGHEYTIWQDNFNYRLRNNY